MTASGRWRLTTENARHLQLAWSYSSGVLRGHEAAPLVVGDTMYVTTPFPNDLLAFDLSTNPPQLKWR